MKVILSTIAGACLATFTITNVWQALEPWANQIMSYCSEKTATTVLTRNTFTGQPIVDKALCMSVAYYQHMLHDLLGQPFQRLMMGAYATVMTIMAFEASRKGNKTSLLALFPLFLVLANGVGLSTVFALWIPLCLYYQYTTRDLPSKAIRYSRAYGFLAAVVVGFGLPSAYLSSPWMEINSRVEEDVIAIWQFIPILMLPLASAFEKVFDWMGSPIDALEDQALKERLYRAEGKDAAERSYLFLGVVNMFIYLGSYLLLGWTGINLKEAIVMLYNAPASLPSGLSFSDLGQLLTTRSVFIDYIVLWVAFVLWAGLSSGLLPAIVVAVMSVAVGPGAAVSFYAYYREGEVQNLENPTVNLIEEEDDDEEGGVIIEEVEEEEEEGVIVEKNDE